MNRYLIDETITQTVTTTYEVLAETRKEALASFRANGFPRGDCVTNNPDGVVIVLEEEEAMK